MNSFAYLHLHKTHIRLSYSGLQSLNNANEPPAGAGLQPVPHENNYFCIIVLALIADQR